MHEAIAAFSRQINVLYYFVLCFCFSVSRRQHEDNQTSGEIGVSVCNILSSLWVKFCVYLCEILESDKFGWSHLDQYHG